MVNMYKIKLTYLPICFLNTVLAETYSLYHSVSALLPICPTCSIKNVQAVPIDRQVMLFY